jgi:hypothetical protein
VFHYPHEGDDSPQKHFEYSEEWLDTEQVRIKRGYEVAMLRSGKIRPLDRVVMEKSNGGRFSLDLAKSFIFSENFVRTGSTN